MGDPLFPCQRKRQLQAGTGGQLTGAVRAAIHFGDGPGELAELIIDDGVHHRVWHLGQTGGDGIHVHREAGGLSRTAKRLQQAIITAAGEDRRSGALHIAPKHHASIIVDLVHQSQVKANIPAVTGLLQ